MFYSMWDPSDLWSGMDHQSWPTCSESFAFAVVQIKRSVKFLKLFCSSKQEFGSDTFPFTSV